MIIAPSRELFNKLKGKSLFIIAIIFSFVSLSYVLCIFKIYQLIPMIFMLVLFVYSIVKIINYIYKQLMGLFEFLEEVFISKIGIHTRKTSMSV